MAYIPKDAKWYLADIVLQITVEGDPRNVVHTNLVLIRADSPQEAYEKALKLGADHELCYDNPEGKRVTFRFRGLRDLNVIHDELEHGAELSYYETLDFDEAAINEWVTPKEELGLFQPITPSSAPDYRSREVVEEMYRQFPDLRPDNSLPQKTDAINASAKNREISYNTPARSSSHNGCMANQVKAIPDGYHTVSPYIVVSGVAKLIEFVKQVFGATEVYVSRRPDGSIQHAEVKIGDSIVMMGESPDKQFLAMLHIYMDNVDAVYRRAIEAGAKSVREPADQPYGDRSAGVEDAFGNQWWISTHIEDVSSEELEKRLKAAKR